MGSEVKKQVCTVLRSLADRLEQDEQDLRSSEMKKDFISSRLPPYHLQEEDLGPGVCSVYDDVKPNWLLINVIYIGLFQSHKFESPNGPDNRLECVHMPLKVLRVAHLLIEVLFSHISSSWKVANTGRLCVCEIQRTHCPDTGEQSRQHGMPSSVESTSICCDRSNKKSFHRHILFCFRMKL